MPRKICEHCGCPFNAAHKYNRWCSRKCLFESSYPKPGDRFNFLTVIGYSHHVESSAYFDVRCDCGTEKKVQMSGLKSGFVKSCGCLRQRTSRENGRKSRRHGMTGTSEWRTYHSAKARCNNPKDKRFADYGGRGIEFRFTSFEEFFNEVGARPTPQHSIDRIDNDGHYEPGNVRWATEEEQRNNKRPRRPQRPP